jgi:hypothetical protein
MAEQSRRGIAGGKFVAADLVDVDKPLDSGCDPFPPAQLELCFQLSRISCRPIVPREGRFFWILSMNLENPRMQFVPDRPFERDAPLNLDDCARCSAKSRLNVRISTG